MWWLAGLSERELGWAFWRKFCYGMALVELKLEFTGTFKYSISRSLILLVFHLKGA